MVTESLNSCPICASLEITSSKMVHADGYRVACRYCGTFSLPGLLAHTILKGRESERETKELLPYLSAHTRQATERGEEILLDEEN